MRFALPFLLCFAAAAYADPPAVLKVQASPTQATWRFDVTLAHPDTGWDHYADGWRIEDATGAILGTRELLHPHETEQPFTRSLSSVSVPQGLTQVRVRAKCSVDGWSDATTLVDLPPR